MINNILKPKSPNQVLNEFCTRHNINTRELREFFIDYRKDRRIWVLVFSIFVWIFSISMIINGIMALTGHYFWIPLSRAHKTMFDFINILWIVFWFAFSLFLIVFGIIILARAYEKY